MADSNMHWDGQQWLQWDGQQWAPAAGAPAPAPAPAPAAYVAPAAVQYQHPTQVMTDQRSKGGETAVAWVLTILTLGYFLPWAIAATRGKSNSAAIGIINFLLGWTFVGWIVALVMACGAHQTGVAMAPAR